MAVLATLVACGGDDGPPPTPLTWDQCDSAADAFVRDAMLALLGRRPTSGHEVAAYVALYDAAEDAHAADPTLPTARAVVAEALLAGPERGPRWTTHFMDALRVARVDDQSQVGCWSEARRPSIDATLATFVRDNPAEQSAGSSFTMLDLAQSAIAADDPTVIYRAQLYALVSRPLVAANVSDIEAELARRADVGTTFDSAYLNRDLVCLGCHNSESSVTDADDPAIDRHWPMPGLVDRAIFGSSNGIAPAVAHAAFRVDGFVDLFGSGGNWRPWGMSGQCGTFTPPSQVGPDPAGVDGRLGSLRGDRLTVRDLDGAMARGLATLRGGMLMVGVDNTIADPDAALAYMVATSIVESVWREVVGTPLTIANYFPRNQAARDQLRTLTEGFIASGYSLDHLLVAIVDSDYFSRLAPADGCSAGPYSYPAVFDPWVVADADPARRGNGPGDAVAPLSARTLLSAAYAALEWPTPETEAFPIDEETCAPLDCQDLNAACQFSNYCCVTHAIKCEGQGDPSLLEEMPFQRAIGAFLKLGERGFRGLDFQARLAWEDRFGVCAKPASVVGDDFIDRAVSAGHATSGATVGDVVSVVKDRLIGEPTIEPTVEAPALAAVLGLPLSMPVGSLDALPLRRLCGVLLSSPQFVLSGVAGRGSPDAPAITVPGDDRAAACARIAAAPPTGWTITCEGDSLTATRTP